MDDLDYARQIDSLVNAYENDEISRYEFKTAMGEIRERRERERSNEAQGN